MNLEALCPWSDFVNSTIHVLSDYFSMFGLLSLGHIFFAHVGFSFTSFVWASTNIHPSFLLHLNDCSLQYLLGYSE